MFWVPFFRKFQLHEIAMLVAECLTSIVDKNGKQLKFDVSAAYLLESFC